MAEYSERTGVVKWQRVVLASQREQIEKRLIEHYPVHAKGQVVEERRRVAAPPESRVRTAAVAVKTAKR